MWKLRRCQQAQATTAMHAGHGTRCACMPDDRQVERSLSLSLSLSLSRACALVCLSELTFVDDPCR